MSFASLRLLYFNSHSSSCCILYASNIILTWPHDKKNWLKIMQIFLRTLVLATRHFFPSLKKCTAWKHFNIVSLMKVSRMEIFETTLLAFRLKYLLLFYDSRNISHLSSTLHKKCTDAHLSQGNNLMPHKVKAGYFIYVDVLNDNLLWDQTGIGIMTGMSYSIKLMAG